MKPILFNTHMVQAIQNGRKTVTRRVMNPQPVGQPYRMKDSSCWPGCFADSESSNVYRPPYQPGDILYVRETFQVDYLSNIIGSGRIKYKDGTYMDIRFAPERYDMMRRAHRKPGWRPNENMPREAARIFLRVKDVRAERLQEIDCAGALAEGCDGRCDVPSNGAAGVLSCSTMDFSVERFQTVWDSTIKSANRTWYGWEANPWVWVIEFEQISRKEANNNA